MPLLESLFSLAKYLTYGIAGLFGIGFIIGFHELGHFLFCKLFKIRTPSFSIGFGPKIIKKKIGETEFSLSAIPVGGYVEIAGAAEVGQGEQKEAYSDDAYSFARKPWWQKMCVILGGIAFNLIFAYFALALIFLMGAPKSPMLYPLNAYPVIAAIEAGSPAEKAGLKVGDRISKIDGKIFAYGQAGKLDDDIKKNDDDLRLAAGMPESLKSLKEKANQPVHFTIERDGTTQEVDVTLGSKEIFGKTCGNLGVVFEMHDLKGFPLPSAIAYGIKTANAYIATTACAFKHMFSKRDMSGAGGPLMIISATIKGAGQGFKIFLLLLALISINLAILNLIPVPILDGGQMLFYTIEAIFRRPLPIKVKEYIHIASWVAFMILLVYLSAQDLKATLLPYFEKVRGWIGR